jgi:hypothetical protein
MPMLEYDLDDPMLILVGFESLSEGSVSLLSIPFSYLFRKKSYSLSKIGPSSDYCVKNTSYDCRGMKF